LIIIYNLLYITEKKNLLKGKLIIKGKKLKDYKKTSTHCPPPPGQIAKGRRSNGSTSYHKSSAFRSKKKTPN